MFPVPKGLTEDVEKLLQVMDAKVKPVYVACKPKLGAPQNECFPLVEAKVSESGGRAVLGWQIWQGTLIIEAEFHAVWESPDGDMFDITPKQIPLDRIMFLVDEEAIYKGAQVNNIRVNRVENPLVDDFISIHNAIFKIENKGERAFQYQLSLSGREAEIYQQLQAYKSQVEFMAMQIDNKNSACPCGSGDKYKHCHGKNIKKLLKGVQ